MSFLAGFIAGIVFLIGLVFLSRVYLDYKYYRIVGHSVKRSLLLAIKHF